MGKHTRRRRLLYGVAGALLVGGITVVTIGLAGQHHAPQPAASAASPAAVTPATVRPSTPPTSPRPHVSPSHHRTALLQLPPSPPTHISVPAIGVDSVVHPLGLAADGTVQVPPLSRDSWAGWYRNSPTPGQIGPAIILGHIDSAKYGPGVFFRLGALHPHDTVSITRADHTIAVFTVQRVVSVLKDHFPTIAVYGPTAGPQLRLITCGGKFDFSARSYESNIIVYAVLTGVRAAY